MVMKTSTPSGFPQINPQTIQPAPKNTNLNVPTYDEQVKAGTIQTKSAAVPKPAPTTVPAPTPAPAPSPVPAPAEVKKEPDMSAFYTPGGLSAEDIAYEERLQQMSRDKKAAEAEEKSATAPNVAESTTKVNVDGSTTTETKDFTTPEAQEYKKQMDDSMRSIEAEIEYARSKFTAIAEGADIGQAALIEAITKTFEVRKYEMERINTSALNTQTLLGNRSKRSRYAPEIQSSILSEEERAGLVRYTEIESLEFQTIAAAQQAATEEDLMILNERMTTLGDLRQEKTNIIQSIYNSAVLEEQRSQQRAKFALDMKSYENEIAQFQRQNQAAYAGAMATDLVRFDDQFNPIAPTQLEIQQAAAESGIDPMLLSQAVFEQIQELQGMNSAEYGTYFENQKLAADLAQQEFSNILNSQKFALEEKMFGQRVTEFEYEMFQDQLVNTSTGQLAGVMDWAKGIKKGTAKFSDVPDTMRTAVMSALNALPPEISQVRKVEAKVNTLDSLAQDDGLKYAVGPNALARTGRGALIGGVVGGPVGGVIGYQMAKNKRNAFTAKMDNILSAEVLNQLIGAKADGATFGALSDAELAILQSAASPIMGWARDTDGDGKTDYYEIDEANFKAALDEVTNKYRELVSEGKKELAQNPYTDPAEFGFRASAEDKELFAKFANDPAFVGSGKSEGEQTRDIIQAINAVNGFFGERGGNLVKSAFEKNFPAGEKGGQCGTFAHKIVKFPPVGDLKEQKFASVDKFGIKKENWSPQVGDVVITGEHPKWGHVAVVNEVLPGGKIQLTESNYKSDERISHNRVMELSSSSIYGAIRGSYNI